MIHRQLNQDGSFRPVLSAERLILLLAFLFLVMGLGVRALDLESPGQIIEPPIVTADRDCYFDGAEGVVVAPYAVTGRNDGDVWLSITALVQGLGASDVEGTGAMLSPDGSYTMHGDVEIELETEPRKSATSLSCRLTAKRAE